MEGIRARPVSYNAAMRNTGPTTLLLALTLAFPPALADDPPPAILAHDIEVALDPDAGTIAATDRMTVRRSASGGEVAFDLRADLEIRRLEMDGKADDTVARETEAPRPGIARYRVRVPKGPGETGVLAVSWAGTIREEVRKAQDLAFVVGDHSRGTISPEGVFLVEGTGWVPLGRDMASFRVRATAPEGWTVVTQGPLPADGLWLQAGKWTVDRRTTAGGVAIGTFLSGRNAGLSKLILDSVEEYLVLYEKVLGPYPHGKFDVVENFFSTGYGMPSATLLGGDVLQHMGMMAQRAGGRIPPGYIDHELVHCWWGNGVFVDYDHGNWCEALTSYCSNYLRKEWESDAEGARHRRGTRARFAARVSPEKDYPLRRFTGKTEDFENDIGYGKGSMVFHMVRRAVGDGAFFGALQDLTKGFAGKRASWDDLRGCFEKRSGRNLRRLFDAGLDRTGAPVMALEGCAAAAGAGGWTVTGKVVQRGIPWPLTVPVVVETTSGRETATVDAVEAETGFSIRTTALPLRVLLDPDSEVWRGYAPGEAPAMLDSALHDAAGLDCLLSTPNSGIAYAPVVEAVQARGVVVWTPKTGEPELSGTRSTLVLGHLATGGTMATALQVFRPLLRVDGETLQVGNERFEGPDVSLLASIRNPADPRRTITIYGGMSDAALSGARRIFFYGGDGVVVFKAGRPVLRLEPEGEESSRASLLATALPGASEVRAMALVEALCSRPCEGRLAGSEEGRAAMDLLVDALRSDGLAVRLLPFSFPVADWDGTSCLGLGEGKEAPLTGVPFCFSPPVPEWRPYVTLSVEPDTAIEGFLSSLREIVEGGAEGVLVVGPPDPPAALADYLVHPSRLPDAEKAKAPHPPLAVEGRRARLLPPGFEVKVPVVYLGQEKARSWRPVVIRSPVARTVVESANLVAVIPGTDPTLAGEAVLLGAHHDHLGPGFPGANDDASGVAAVREAARLLLAARESLRRPVVVALFGAEEWGLRGSAALAAAPPAGFPRVAAVLNLDTVGQKGVPAVNVVGTSVYPSLGSLASRCLLGAGLETGRNIDKFAFAWGSDHYSFHRAGVPAVDLFSAEYRTMHTAGDAPQTVDPGKVASLARAAAAFALSVSREGLPR